MQAPFPSVIVHAFTGMCDAGPQIADIVCMGFSADIARHALMRYGGDSERALDWLLNVGEEAAAAAAGVAGHSAAGAAQAHGCNIP